MHNLKEVYEEEAHLRGDALSKIYSRGALKGSQHIPFWARYLLRMKQAWLEEALSQNAEKDFRVLDLGCGSGYLNRKNAPADFRIYGLDLSNAYLAIARQQAHSDVFIQGDALQLPFKDQSFDLVICSEVLEHLPDHEKALEEIKRVTRKIFICTVPLLPKIVDQLRLIIQGRKAFLPGKGHFRNYQAGSYLDLLRKKGFKIKTVQCVGALWGLSFFEERLEDKWRKGIRRADFFFSNLRIFRPFALNMGVVAER